MATDIERLRNETSLSQIASQYGVKLSKNGHEYDACCPFHSENTASFTIFRGNDGVERFHCFGCGERGDVVDFVQRIKGVDTREAIAILGGRPAGENVKPRQIGARDIYAGIEPYEPPEMPAGQRLRIYNPKRVGTEMEWGGFVPSRIHPYRRKDGRVFGYVLRHDLRDGGKETPMVMWVQLPSGEQCWCRFPFPKPRPLYGLERVAEARQVIVVEGEKCRDEMVERTGLTVVSWVGGTQGVKHTNWKPLAGKNVVMWPDHDPPGLETANEIGAILKDLNCTFRVLRVQGIG